MRYLAVSLLLLSTAAAQPKRIITHADIFSMKRVGDPAVSPDGKWAVFSVTEPDYDPAKQSSDLWMVPTDGSAPPRKLTFTRSGESGATFSPDGKWLAFSAKRDGDDAAQIYLLPLEGGEAKRVTSIPSGAESPQFRPDGKAILFESMVYPGAKTEEEQKKVAADRRARKYNARAFDTFPIRYWNAWLDEQRAHVFVQELGEGAGKAKDLLAGTKLDASPGFSGTFNPAGGGQQLNADWSPDGKEVVFAGFTNRHETMYAAAETHIFKVSAEGGAEPEQLSPAGQSFANPKFSPDGKTLYALHQRNPNPKGRLYSLTRLARWDWPIATLQSKASILTEAWDRSVSAFTVSPDSSMIVIEAEDDGYDKLFRLPARGSAKVELLVAPKEGGYSGVVSTMGGLIGKYGSSIQPAQIAKIDPSVGGTHKLLTNFDAATIAQLDWQAPEHFWFTARNGKKIHNILTKPPAFDPAKKYPLLIFPHGGPNAMSKDAFSTRWNFHLLVSQGYVLLQTNYTGSTGFGEKFADDIERDVLRGPVNEVMEAIDEAIKKYPFIDRTRQAAAGASYSGYMMNWINGHNRQFRCLVNHAGAVNNESQYGVNDGGLDRELRMGGPIWGKTGQWMDQSPMRYAGAFHTPMLITQGELDFRVPLSESITSFKLMQRLKVPVRLLTFPEEGHWILRGENSKLHMQEVLAWLKKYLEPEKPIWQ